MGVILAPVSARSPDSSAPAPPTLLPHPPAQGAVRELFAEEDITVAVGSTSEPSAAAAPASKSGGAAAERPAIGRAYGHLVSAVAELQRAYGEAVAKAVGHAVTEVVEVEQAAEKGVEKTKVLLGQKVRLFGW